jgi:hypothetical protein
MASDNKIAKADKPAKADHAPKSEPAAKDKSTSGDAKSKTEAKTESGEAVATAPSGYSRGEGQKPVSAAYKENWNAIFAKKSAKRKKR